VSVGKTKSTHVRAEKPLKEYAGKRDFARTPEPVGSAIRGEGRDFVVQKHAARRLHYDLRLERSPPATSLSPPFSISAPDALRSRPLRPITHRRWRNRAGRRPPDYGPSNRHRHPGQDVLVAVFAAVKFSAMRRKEVAAVVEDHAGLFSDT
jgi:hypothetical protein